MNFRKPIIYALLYLSGSKIPKYLKEMKGYERLSAEEIQRRTNKKLERILLHAYENVPYYHKILAQCGVVENGKVNLEKFSDIPLLTKDIIRSQGENLYSKDRDKRKPFDNTSGGSTGEPVRFIQDSEFLQWNTANKLYFNMTLGKDIGQRELKFWGSDRDILQGTLTLKERMINRLYNRKFFNSYILNDQRIRQVVELNNRFKPVAYWSYMESARELANGILAQKLDFYPPKIVITTAGPLTAQTAELIELAMKCKVYNQYGSREIGVIACQCKEQKGMHTFPWRNYMEVVDDYSKPIFGHQGDIVVTTLHNFSMPLIRYKIGDVGIAGKDDCSCGMKTPVLENVLGRAMEYFKKADGSLAHSHFIIHPLWYRPWLKRFQIIQEDFGHIVIKVQLNENQTAPQGDLDDIITKTKVIMGADCKVEFDFVDTIEATASGKYMYLICKV